MRKLLAIVFACAALFAPAAFADQLTLGTAQVSSIASASCSNTLLARDACLQFVITCPTSVRTARVKVTFEVGTRVRPLLTISGGDGGGFDDAAYPNFIPELQQLRDAGYRLLQVQWTSNPFNPDAPVTDAVDNACQFGTLIEAVHANTTTNPGAQRLIVTGNSGGASQLTYALTRYGAAAYIAKAIPTSGPPHGVLHLGCPGTTKSAWLTECQATHRQNGAGACTFFNSGVSAQFIDAAWGDGRTTCAAHVDSPRLQYNSVCSQTATLWFADTAVEFIFSADDPSEAVAFGHKCATQFLDATITITTGTHDMPNSTGAAAIVDAVLSAD